MTCAIVLVVLTVVDASVPIAYICICGLYLVVVVVVILFPFHLVSSNSANVFFVGVGGGLLVLQTRCLQRAWLCRSSSS